MAKDPNDRFQTMTEFCGELEACLAELQSNGTQVIAAPGAPARPRTQRRGVNPWPFVLALLVLIAIGGVIAYLIVRQHNNNPATTPPTTSGSGAPHLTGVGAWDPDGTGGEHDSQAHLATDGDSSSAWETEHYRDPPSLGKPGVGLVLDAGSAVTLHQLGLVSATPGFTAVIRAGDSKTGPFPDTVSASQVVPPAGAQYTITESKPHRYYVIWITRLAPDYNTAKINEIRAA
jgi:hypothetical protein